VFGFLLGLTHLLFYQWEEFQNLNTRYSDLKSASDNSFVNFLRMCKARATTGMLTLSPVDKTTLKKFVVEMKENMQRKDSPKTIQIWDVFAISSEVQSFYSDLLHGKITPFDYSVTLLMANDYHRNKITAQSRKTDHFDVSCKACGDECKHDTDKSECTYSRVRNAKWLSVAVFTTEEKGNGLKATEPIPKEKFILEYCGVVEQKKTIVQSEYIFKCPNYMIDAMQYGSVARFINHCCESNCLAKTVRIDGFDRVLIFSKRAIRKDEEITIDYRGDIRTGELTFRCRCSSRKCLETTNLESPQGLRKGQTKSSLPNAFHQLESSECIQPNRVSRMQSINLSLPNAVQHLESSESSPTSQVFRRQSTNSNPNRKRFGSEGSEEQSPITQSFNTCKNMVSR